MTDQQTSRTNIPEALRALAAGWDAQAIGAGTYSASTLRRCARSLRERLDVLAAEPRSDAVTAPDEPSTGLDVGRLVRQWESHAHFLEDAADATADRKHAAALRGEARGVDWARRILFARYSIEREARAASASVPPLDESAAALADRITAAVNAKQRPVDDMGLASILHHYAHMVADDRDTAAETPERGSSQRSDRKNLSTYQAETPEQGRGDE